MMSQRDVQGHDAVSIPSKDGASPLRSDETTTEILARKTPDVVIELQDVTKTYRSGDLNVNALQGISLKIERGNFVAVMGPSGSGKSTLMHILGCLDTPTSGVQQLDGADVSGLSEIELANVRNQKIGFVFQSFNLLSTMSAWRNVELPMIYGGVARPERKERAHQALEAVGLSGRSNHKPGQLSGGQQQRVAVARAIVTDPSIILADEPTGNLDSVAAADVLGLFEELHQKGRTVILITHEQDVANVARRIVHIRDGKIQSVDERSP